MTGTPLDLTPFGSVLEGIGLLYWAVVLAAVGLVAWKARGWALKLLGCTAVLAVLVLPVALHALDRQRQIDAAKARLAAATAHFEMRCRGAGERIHRTVEGVDGVVWMKWREPVTNVGNFADQFKLDDPYGRDCGGEDCIVRLLRATDGLALDPQKKQPHHAGYAFVESVDPRDGKTYRYRLRLYRPFDRDPKWLDTLVRPELVASPIDKFTARYGVTWDDISTVEDRQHWVAGGSLKVIDLQTGEVIAERVGYMLDRGQGSQAGFRSPWSFAEFNACPSFPQVSPSDARRKRTGNENRQFLQRALRPTKGE